MPEPLTAEEIAVIRSCVMRISRLLDTHDALAREVETLQQERDDARLLVCEVALGVTHYTGPGGCGDPSPCVRCRAETAQAQLAVERAERDRLAREVETLREAERERDEAQAPAGQTPPPAPAACPERDECLRLRGQPIGMYHCTHCGTMVLAGVDPTPLCPWVSGGGTEAHETPTRPALTADVRTQAEGLCPVCDHRADWHVETGCLAETDITLRRCGCLAVTDSTPPRPALTAEQREALRQKAEAATPGGWVAVEAPQGWWTVESSSEERVRLLSRIAELENVVFHVKQWLLDSKARVEQEVHYLTEVYNRKV